MTTEYRQSKLSMLHRALRTRFKGEAPTIRFIRNLDMAGATMLDIGANHGDVGIFISRAAGPEGRLVSFEAQPELGPHLENVRRQFDLENQTIVNKGLSSKPGRLRMQRSKVGAGGATVEGLNTDSDDNEVLEIEVTSLDEVLPELGVHKVSFIKCDVEGHELEVFRGGRNMLERDRPVIVFEGHDSELADGQMETFLGELGYSGWFFYVSPEHHKSIFTKAKGHYVPFRDRLDYPHVKPNIQHRNYIFVPDGSHPEDFQARR